jgi:hypothetical protein
MSPLTSDENPDRRILPERRRYSYDRYIPERRTKSPVSDFLEPIQTDRNAKKIDGRSKKNDQNLEAEFVLFRDSSRLPPKRFKKSPRTSKSASIFLRKQQLLARLEKEFNKKNKGVLTKEEIMDLIKKL